MNALDQTIADLIEARGLRRTCAGFARQPEPSLMTEVYGRQGGPSRCLDAALSIEPDTAGVRSRAEAELQTLTAWREGLERAHKAGAAVPPQSDAWLRSVSAAESLPDVAERERRLREQLAISWPSPSEVRRGVAAICRVALGEHRRQVADRATDRLADAQRALSLITKNLAAFDNLVAQVEAAADESLGVPRWCQSDLEVLNRAAALKAVRSEGVV